MVAAVYDAFMWPQELLFFGSQRVRTAAAAGWPATVWPQPGAPAV